MTNVLPDGIEESTDLLEPFRCLVGSFPEQLEVALFQDISQDDDVLDGLILHLKWKEEVFGQHEICMWKVGQAFQENRVCDIQVEKMWVELEQFQHSQVGFQVIGVFSGLFLDVFLEDW